MTSKKDPIIKDFTVTEDGIKKLPYYTVSSLPRQQHLITEFAFILAPSLTTVYNKSIKASQIHDGWSHQHVLYTMKQAGSIIAPFSSHILL